MRALEVQIHNFRSIHDATVQLEALSLVAGPNNAGKSNLIDAIRMFYGDLKWEDARDAPKVESKDKESWVEVEFLPTDDELSQLKDEYRSQRATFRVRNYFRSSLGTDGKVRAGYYAYENERLSENLFYGAKNVGSGKIGHIVYVPAVSKLDDHTKFTGPSALRELVGTVLNAVVAASPAYGELVKAFGAFETEIKSQESADGQSLVALEREITAELSQWDTTFNLGIQSVQPEEVIKTLVKPLLIDDTHGGEVDQQRFGAGFQRHLVYTLIRLAARHSAGPGASPRVKKEFSPDLNWILFEEPEAFLHPSQEEVLHDSLLQLTKESATQVLLSTHSARFVSRSMNDLTRLVRVRRDGGVTTCFQVTGTRLDELFNEALALDRHIAGMVPDGEAFNQLAATSAFKTELWMLPTRAAAFFARRVILVEGPSETALYHYLTTREVMPPPAPGIAVVDCMGKFNIHRFMGLLNAFGVDHSVLYDGDTGKAADAEVTKAIEGSRGDFTMRVTRLQGDLELGLGIPKAVGKNARSGKPQYLLYHLEAGLVPTENLETVIVELNALATSTGE